MNIIKKLKRLYWIFPLFIGGCGIWTNFTTYFNTYFNAVKLYEDAEELILAQDIDVFEFKIDRIPANATTNLNKVIEKGSKILEEGTETAYFDDALFMIGKSYYYLQDFSKALRKFNELSLVQDTDLLLDATYWTGITEMQLRNFQEGFDILEELKVNAGNEGREDLKVNSYIRQISMLVYRENYITAVNYCNELLDYSDDDELKAETAYQLGKIYVELNEIENAAEAFERVSDYSPTPEVEFNSKLESAKLFKQIGRVDESLVKLEDLRYEGKFEDKLDMINYEIGLIYYERNDIEEAERIFYDIDTTFKTTQTAGKAVFMQAEIWEKHFFNFDSASRYYERVMGSQAPQEIKVEARIKSQQIDHYIKLKGDLKKYEKRMAYLLDPESFVRDSLSYEAYLGRDTTQKRDTSAFNFQDELITEKPFRPNMSADSLKEIIAKTEFELGNLFLGEFVIPDSAYYYYTNVIENYDTVSFKPKLLYSIGSYYLTVGKEDSAKIYFEDVYYNYRYDEIANEAAVKLGLPLLKSESDPALDIYEEAEADMDEKEYLSAIDKFYNVYYNYPESVLAPQALFAVGWLYENELNKPDSAAAIYDTLNTKFRNTDYAKATASKLAFFKQENKRIRDSIAAAEKFIADSLAAADSLDLPAVEIMDQTAPPDTSRDFEISEPDTSAVIDTSRARR